MEQGFKESHQHSFLSLAFVVEEKLQEMEALLCASTKLPDTNLQLQTAVDLTTEERNFIEDKILAMRHCLNGFASTYGVNKQHRSLKKILTTKAAFLWEELSGATFNQLQGYGHVDETKRDDYEHYTKTMTDLAEQLMLIPKNNQNEN